MQSFTFDQLTKIGDNIITQNNRLILIAGASASGKSYVAEELVKQLSKSGKKVLLISSDNYYSDESALKYLLYGSFDHPGMIEYDLLARNILEYFQTGKTTIPNYSFVEKRRTHLTEVKEQYDIIIVEGLYTINQLSNSLSEQINNILKIFVHADLEEIIFRRIIRDQKRVSDPLHVIIDVMSKVFPMRNVFGETQRQQSDIMIKNTFNIMDKEGKKSHRISKDRSSIAGYGIPRTIEYAIDYIYNDITNTNDCIIITEVYDQPGGLLRKVMVTRRRSDIDHTRLEDYESISLSMYQPGIVTVLHTLVQLAGLKFIESYDKKLSLYTTEQMKEIIIKEKGELIYELQ